jgi:uncharacterized protein (DUF934 family)
MPLIKKGAFVADRFLTVADGAELPEGAAVIVSLKRWQAERDALLARGTAVGVKLPNNTNPEVLKDDLPHLAVVALDFPIFRDGRSYSWARLLRQRFAYKGEIRATGNVLRDQVFFMSRVGIDAFEVPEGFQLVAFSRAMRDFSHAYQPSIDGRRTVVDLRHSQRIAAE